MTRSLCAKRFSLHYRYDYPSKSTSILRLNLSPYSPSISCVPARYGVSLIGIGCAAIWTQKMGQSSLSVMQKDKRIALFTADFFTAIIQSSLQASCASTSSSCLLCNKLGVEVRSNTIPSCLGWESLLRTVLAGKSLYT